MFDYIEFTRILKHGAKDKDDQWLLCYECGIERMSLVFTTIQQITTSCVLFPPLFHTPALKRFVPSAEWMFGKHFMVNITFFVMRDHNPVFLSNIHINISISSTEISLANCCDYEPEYYKLNIKCLWENVSVHMATFYARKSNLWKI
jgi:hypothetical protein